MNDDSMVKCPYCGADYEAYEKVCPLCGTPNQE
jgi:uncharacterized Zn-finger protein